MSSAGRGPQVSDEELALLEERFATTCLDAVVLGVLTPDEVRTIQRRLRERRRRNAEAPSPPAADQP